MLVLFSGPELLHVDCVLHLEALKHRRLVELLTAAKLFHHTSLLKLSLELLKCSLNVLAFFYRYNNHSFFLFKYLKIRH